MITNVPPIKTENDIMELEIRMRKIFESDLDRSVAGERKYNSSWRKRGGTGAYENICRKIDRLESAGEKCGNNIFRCVLENPASDGNMFGKDGLLDDIRDLRIYLALVEDYMTSLYDEGI